MCRSFSSDRHNVPKGMVEVCMMLQHEHELANSHEKLRLLEISYDEARQEPCIDEELRETELETRNQFIHPRKKRIRPLRSPSGGAALTISVY